MGKQPAVVRDAAVAEAAKQLAPGEIKRRIEHLDRVIASAKAERAILRSEQRAAFQRARAAKSEARRQELIRRWNDGEPVKRIAAAVGMSASWVHSTVSALRREGVELRRREPHKLDRAQVALLAGQGLTYRDIGDTLGATTSTIAAILAELREAGVDIPERAPGAGPDGPTITTIRRRERIADLYKRGTPIAGIAERLGTTPGHVKQQIQRMRDEGWDLPYRRRPMTPEQIAARKRRADQGNAGDAGHNSE